MIEEAKLIGDCVVRKSWDGASWIGNNGSLKAGTIIWIDKALSHDGYTRTTIPIIGWIPTVLIGVVVIPPPMGKVKTHDIDIYNDGSLVIDGIPYP